MTPHEHRLMKSMFVRQQLLLNALIMLLNNKNIMTADEKQRRLALSEDELKEFTQLVEQEERGNRWGALAAVEQAYDDGAASLGLNISQPTPKRICEILRNLFRSSR